MTLTPEQLTALFTNCTGTQTVSGRFIEPLRFSGAQDAHYAKVGFGTRAHCTAGIALDFTYDGSLIAFDYIFTGCTSRVWFTFDLYADGVMLYTLNTLSTGEGQTHFEYRFDEKKPRRVQIYLPDLKYADGALAAELSGAADYFPVACEAIREMFRQVGPYVLEDGLLTRGVVIRHLVLPGYLDNTRRVLDWIAETFAPGDVLVSLMSQYTPTANMTGRLARRVTAAEYRAAADYMRNCGITDGFVQERTSAEEAYTPAFDGEGV